MRGGTSQKKKTHKRAQTMNELVDMALQNTGEQTHQRYIAMSKAHISKMAGKKQAPRL